MISARALEHRMPVIAGRIKAAQTNLSILQAVLPSLFGPDIPACTKAILSLSRTITNNINLMTTMTQQWGQVRGDDLSGDIAMMVGFYCKEACALIVQYDGILMTARPADVYQISGAITQILNNPEAPEEPTARILTVLGFKDLTMLQLQGLLTAAGPLEQAGCHAQVDTITHNDSVPFTDWDGIKEFYDLKFGEYYEP